MPLSKQSKRQSASFSSESEESNDEPWLFRILNRAAAYGDMLSRSGKESGDKSDDDCHGTRPGEVLGRLGQDLADISVEEPLAAKDEKTWQCGGTERWLNLSAASWLKTLRRDADTTDSFGSESDDESRVDSDSSGPDGTLMLPDEGVFTEEPATISDASLPQTDDRPPLSSKEKVDLIISEFGALTGEGEEETLLAETDGAFFQDVAILGIMHLTTHRITFHASLLSTRPDLALSRRILHAGSATIRTMGNFQRKKRVWMELTHDMITTYRGSGDKERVRPLRAILLSAFRKIYPFDRRHPRQIKLEYATSPTKSSPSGSTLKKFTSQSVSRSLSLKRDSSLRGSLYLHKSGSHDTDVSGKEQASKDCLGTVTDMMEFATEEAALGWRRELQAALYVHRIRQQAALKPKQDPDETTADPAETGVRISVPYTALCGRQIHRWEKCALILQLDLGPQTTDVTDGGENAAASSETCVEHFITSGPLTYGWENGSQQGEIAKLQFAFLKVEEIWGEFDGIVARARKRATATASPKPSAVVDFGPLTFVESDMPVFAAEDISATGEVAYGSREREMRRLFGLGNELDIWMVKCYLHRTLCTSGLLVISKKFVCFWSRFLTGSDIKLRYHTDDVRRASTMRTWCPAHALSLHIAGQPSLQLEFSRSSVREETITRLNAVAVPAVLSTYIPRSSQPNSIVDKSISVPSSAHSSPRSSSSAYFSHRPTVDSNIASTTPTAILSPLSRTVARARACTFPPALLAHLAKPINVPDDILMGISPRHFVCLTIGSRGDVQPYIALGRGLQLVGHRVTLVTHGEYKDWIEGWGLTHRTAGGDPGALMKLNVDHKMFSPQFFKESLTHFRVWIDELLVDAWEQCKDADVLIESPSAMAGVHIAEALSIPYFRAFTMPWSKTVHYPHPFISPPVDNRGSFNLASYVLFDNVFWLGTSSQINRWRKKHLQLPATDMGHMAQTKIPFIYNFSPSVVPKPLDWGDQISITGYWFLDNPDIDWRPSEQLLRFIAKARLDDKPLVYIGFGSITVPSPTQLTQNIVKAVLKSDVRAILSKGWSARMQKEESEEVDLPPEVFVIDSAPHDWLFTQMSAVLHHGGAGTTGASLRAGVPTLIKPWFGDQFFWATRVQRLGAGLKVSSLRPSDLAETLRKATTDTVMQEKAAAIGERIRQENGVSAAIKAIYLYLDRAGKDRTTLH